MQKITKHYKIENDGQFYFFFLKNTQTKLPKQVQIAKCCFVIYVNIYNFNQQENVNYFFLKFYMKIFITTKQNARFVNRPYEELWSP